MSTKLVYLLWLLLREKHWWFWYGQFYMKSAHWKEVRERKKKSVKYRCEKCPKHGFHSRRQRLEVHHLHYKSLFHEKNSDLQVLCKFHHDMEHKK